VRYLAAVTDLAWYGEEPITTITAHLQETEAELECRAPMTWLPVIWHKILIEKRPLKHVSMDAWGLQSD
jgi:hypothetical protein